jgi:cold-inducible RNA-binding protein
MPLGGIMGNKLYVGNLSYSASEENLSQTFSECGSVASVKIITDRETGRSKGFGFVEMSSDSEAQAVISRFNGTEYEGRKMNISEAKPMEKRDNRGGGRGGFSQNRGGGGGGGGRW